MIRPVLMAVTLLGATPAFSQEPVTQLYQLELSILRNGVESVSTRTQIAEDMTASAAVTSGDVTYEFEASLFTVQGDGNARQVMLEANLARGEQSLSSPRMSFMSGHEAMIEIGDEQGEMTRVRVTPIN